MPDQLNITGVMGNLIYAVFINAIEDPVEANWKIECISAAFTFGMSTWKES